MRTCLSLVCKSLHVFDTENSTWQIEGEVGLPSPKEAGQRETILVRMDDFPKVFQRLKTLIFLKDSVIFWKLRADATTVNGGKFSLSNLANLYLVDVNKVTVSNPNNLPRNSLSFGKKVCIVTWQTSIWWMSTRCSMNFFPELGSRSF